MRSKPLIQVALLHDAAELVGLRGGVSSAVVRHLLSQLCGHSGSSAVKFWSGFRFGSGSVSVSTWALSWRRAAVVGRCVSFDVSVWLDGFYSAERCLPFPLCGNQFASLVCVALDNFLFIFLVWRRDWWPTYGDRNTPIRWCRAEFIIVNDLARTLQGHSCVIIKSRNMAALPSLQWDKSGGSLFIIFELFQTAQTNNSESININRQDSKGIWKRQSFESEPKSVQWHDPFQKM